MSKLKRTIPFLLVLAILSTTVCLVFAFQSPNAPMELTQITYSFDSETGNGNNFTFYYSDYMIMRDARSLSEDLARASVAMAMTAYDKSYIQSLLLKLGFEDDSEKEAEHMQFFNYSQEYEDKLR